MGITGFVKSMRLGLFKAEGVEKGLSRIDSRRVEVIFRENYRLYSETGNIADYPQ